MNMRIRNRTISAMGMAIGGTFLLAALSLGGASGCGSSSGGGGSGSGGTPISNTTTVKLTPGTAAMATISSGGGANTLNFNFPANAVSTQTTATISEVAQANLPTSFKAPAMVPTQLCAGNTYVTAFLIGMSGITSFNVPVQVSGTVPTTFAVGTTFNLAELVSGAWNDVGTFTVGGAGAITAGLPSTTLPGVTGPGTYLIYQPDPACSTAVSNFGIALIADDGGVGELQVVNLYSGSGTPLAKPAIKTLSYSNAGDLDGQALTPSGSFGILVDGGNTVRFFSNVNTGAPIASTLTLDVSAYGGDGDSVAIMPDGDEAVISADSSSQLLVVSGIASGAPKEAITITVPSNRDSVVISNDGKVLLARGPSGLTVFSIAAITPTAGTIDVTSTIKHSFTQVADLPELSGFHEDGRGGIASDPGDSSRAVIIGSSTDGSTAVTPLTDLPATPTEGTAITLTGVIDAMAVSITPDGKLAIVGTDAGIVLVSGVDTGTLAAVGTPFAPSYAGSSGTVTLGQVTTLGITLDGKYVVVCDQTNDALLMIPFTASGFSAPVGILNSTATTPFYVPANDQMVLH